MKATDLSIPQQSMSRYTSYPEPKAWMESSESHCLTMIRPFAFMQVFHRVNLLSVYRPTVVPIQFVHAYRLSISITLYHVNSINISVMIKHHILFFKNSEYIYIYICRSVIKARVFKSGEKFGQYKSKTLSITRFHLRTSLTFLISKSCAGRWPILMKHRFFFNSGTRGCYILSSSDIWHQS